MPRRLLTIALCCAVPLALLAGACGSDDGSDVRNVGSDGSASGSASGSGSGSAASGSGSASGSASGTGLSGSELSTIETEDALVLEGVARYEDYLGGQVEEMIAKTRTFTDAVRAGNLAAARRAYAPSREPWERIEPIAGLVPDIDTAVDARVDDFAGPADPTFTGWHRLEHLLWVRGTTAGGARFADRLDADLARLQRELGELEIPPAAVALGAAELIEEVSQGKITGEEDRYSKTDLWDFAANVEGAEQVIDALAPALQAADPDLLGRIEAGFADLDAELDTLRAGDGFVLFCQAGDEFPSPLCPRTTVTRAQIDRLKAMLAGLSEDLALVPGALGLS
jgi:iron uptake system component EfeO